jgi:hypothetical protein
MGLFIEALLHKIAIYYHIFYQTTKSPSDREEQISTVHLELLRTIHDCKWIAALYSWLYPEYEIKTPYKTGGKWIGLFCLTLSDISAETHSFETKRQDHFRSKIESEKTFATSPADTEQTSNKGKITNRKTSFFMAPQRNYLLYGAFNSS